jgi:hypothetical protein
MTCTMNMLAPIKMHKPHGPIPNGMKVTAITGPNTLQPAPSCPVLAIGGFTLWPLSYVDNRVSFGMVMYNLKGKVVHALEHKGARYIYKITLTGSGASGSVTFWGQADQKVTMSVSEICQMLC